MYIQNSHCAHTKRGARRTYSLPLTEDKSIVTGCLDELDLKTSNEEMIKAGEQFGFNIVRVHGKIYGWMAEISKVHGYGDTSSYRRLPEKWEIIIPNIGWFGSR